MNQENMVAFLNILSESEGKVLFFFVFFAIIYHLYFAFCLSMIAQKTATKNDWLAWIPLFNFLLALRIARKADWWFVLFLIPLVNIIIYLLVWMSITEILRKQMWLSLFMLIPPLNLVILGYLAFSSGKENGQGPTIIASI